MVLNMNTLVYYDLGHSYSSNGISRTMDMFGLNI